MKIPNLQNLTLVRLINDDEDVGFYFTGNNKEDGSFDTYLCSIEMGSAILDNPILQFQHGITIKVKFTS